MPDSESRMNWHLLEGDIALPREGLLQSPSPLQVLRFIREFRTRA